MKGITESGRLPERADYSGGFSVVMAEKVLNMAVGLGTWEQWQSLALGRPTKRKTGYRSEQRIAAVMAGLACGLRGIAPGNFYLRTNSALRGWLEGRFPDQGTIHRWLQAATSEQSEAFRRHLHQVVHAEGRYRTELWSDRLLFVDIDGQGLIARGRRFQRAETGYLGEGIDRGYQRYVAYVGRTREVLDVLLLPGNCTLMTALEQVLDGLDAVFREWEERRRVVVRADTHAGTVANLRSLRQRGYHYLCPPMGPSALKRMIRHVEGRPGSRFRYIDSQGHARDIEYWILPRWKLTSRESQSVITWATVFHDHTPGAKRPWSALLSDLEGLTGMAAWENYTPRGGTIEEFNDQSERAYHLEIMRTGNLAGLQVVQVLAGLCWNLTAWATETLRLPPVLAPHADRSAWVAAVGMDLAQLLQRASYSGLRLSRRGAKPLLEIDDTAGTPESAAWRRWLHEPHQLHLPLAG